MSSAELQAEEREVLSSIYDGDEAFKQLNPNTYQYKYGVNDTPKSFLLEISWGEMYPNEPPQVNMDTFYNKHVIDNVKRKIIDAVSKEAEQFLGMSMTYSLFEYVKEKYDQLIEEQPEAVDSVEVDKLLISENDHNDHSDYPKKLEKKEFLTKAQKRRAWNKMDNKGEKPRGWNWVDIVKHLSQTGSKETSSSPAT